MSSANNNSEPKKAKKDSFLVGFLAGAVGSSISETITIPLDTAKVRMMLYGMSGKYATVSSTLRTIKTEQGFARLWKGFDAAIARQIVFAGLKLALYEPLKVAVCSNEEEIKMTPLHKKIFAGVVGGGIACYFASPFDLVKIRMQDAEKSKNYKGTLDCYKQIFLKEGGVKGYFKGVWPNVARNAFMNAAELSAYDTTKQLILTKTSLPDHPALYFVYGASAGIVGALCAQPVDIIKTRTMNNPEKYPNALACIKIVLSEGGPLAFYNGLRPFMVRAVSFNCLMFLFFGYAKEFFSKRIDGE